MGNVVLGSFETTLAIPVDRVAEAADHAGLKLVIVIGVDSKGEFYFASSEGDSAMVLWQLERAKKQLLSVLDAQSD
jgi:hypothetical protein